MLPRGHQWVTRDLPYTLILRPCGICCNTGRCLQLRMCRLFRESGRGILRLKIPLYVFEGRLYESKNVDCCLIRSYIQQVFRFDLLTMCIISCVDTTLLITLFIYIWKHTHGSVLSVSVCAFCSNAGLVHCSVFYLSNGRFWRGFVGHCPLSVCLNYTKRKIKKSKF